MSTNAINNVKPPEPQISSSSAPAQKRVYNAPKVGVVSPAKISTTPLGDSLEIAKQENPRIKYKYRVQRNYDLINIHNVIAGVVGLLGVGALFSLFKK